MLLLAQFITQTILQYSEMIIWGLGSVCVFSMSRPSCLQLIPNHCDFPSADKCLQVLWAALPC